jgi:hypothetical protein
VGKNLVWVTSLLEKYQPWVAISAQYAISKLYNDPLLRVSISLVASEDGKWSGKLGSGASEEEKTQALSIAVSLALLLAFTVGMVQLVLYFGFASSILKGWVFLLRCLCITLLIVSCSCSTAVLDYIVFYRWDALMIATLYMWWILSISLCASSWNSSSNALVRFDGYITRSQCSCLLLTHYIRCCWVLGTHRIPLKLVTKNSSQVFLFTALNAMLDPSFIFTCGQGARKIICF